MAGHGQQVCTGAPGAPPSSPVIQSEDVPFTSMAHETPSLVTMTANILQDVATRLDGHSLLALLSTCRDLHGSPALRACLFEAVLHQLGALEAALQDILQALPEAEALLGCAEQVHHALHVQQPGHYTGVAIGRVCEAIAQQAAATKRSAVEALQQARATVTAAQQAAGQPGQQAQAAWQEVGDIVVQARQGALTALFLEPAGEPLGQEGLDVGAAVQRALLALQQALHHAPEGQLGVRGVLQTVQETVQAMHQPVVWQSAQQAMQTVQSFIQARQEASSEATPGMKGTSQAWQPVQFQQRELLAMEELVQDLLESQQALHQLQRLLPAAGGPAMGAAVVAIQAASEELTAVKQAMQRLVRVQLQLKQEMQRVMLQAAGRQLLAGQPQVDKAGKWLMAQVQAMSGDLKQEAQELLQECVGAGVRLLLQQADGNVPLGVLRAAVQAGQAMLQGLEG